MEPLRLTPSAGGWIHADWGDGHCWVRFLPDADGKLELAELHTAEPERLRAIPLGRIRAACMMRGAGGVVLATVLRINEEMPQGALSERPSEGWEVPKRHRLKRPQGRRLDDAFYEDVAAAYESAVAHGLNPNKTIAGDVGVEVSTVAAWVKKARRLGSLEPGISGRAGRVGSLADRLGDVEDA